MNLVRELHKHERKEFSQNGEDGVIERLFAILGVTNRFYVELGTGPGVECNTRLLRERGWKGVMLDRDFANPAIGLHRDLVTAENVNTLFEKYAVPESFDLLSIDIDGNDYWVWKALSPRHQPRVVVIEFNAGVPADVPVVMPYEPAFRWSGEANCGQSLAALQKVSATKGYALVYAAAPNAYLVRRELLPRGHRDVAPAKAMPRHWRLLNQAARIQWQRELRHLDWVYV